MRQRGVIKYCGKPPALNLDVPDTLASPETSLLVPGPRPWRSRLRGAEESQALRGKGRLGADRGPRSTVHGPRSRSRSAASAPDPAGPRTLPRGGARGSVEPGGDSPGARGPKCTERRPRPSWAKPPCPSPPSLAADLRRLHAVRIPREAARREPVDDQLVVPTLWTGRTSLRAADSGRREVGFAAGIPARPPGPRSPGGQPFSRRSRLSCGRPHTAGFAGAPLPHAQRPEPSTQRPIPSTQLSAPSAQCPVPSARHPVPRTQHPAPSTQHPTPSAQHPTQHPEPSTQLPAPSFQRPAPNSQHPAPSTQHPTPSTQPPAPSTQLSTQRPAPSSQSPAPSAQHPTLST